MATTTEEAIRDRIIAVIESLTPTFDAASRFRAYRNEGGADFLGWCDANTRAAWRRFQVRGVGDDEPPAVSNLDVEQRVYRVRLLVAYPHDHRAGRDGALDRDDVMRADQHTIERAIGWAGGANFTAPYPDACWMQAEHFVERVPGATVDVLEMRLGFMFYRAFAA